MRSSLGPATLPVVSVILLSRSGQIWGKYLKLGHYRCCSHLFQFIMHSVQRCTSRATNTVVKYSTKIQIKYIRCSAISTRDTHITKSSFRARHTRTYVSTCFTGTCFQRQCRSITPKILYVRRWKVRMPTPNTSAVWQTVFTPTISFYSGQ